MNRDKNGAIIYHRESFQADGLHRLCQEAAKMMPLNRVVEVGSFMGEAAEVFCKYFSEVYCVDTWEPASLNVTLSETREPIPIEDIEESFDIRQRASKGKICKVIEPSPWAAARFPINFFDMAYIDAAHDYDSVVVDLRVWKVKTRGLMAGHDYCETGEVERAVRAELGMPHWLFVDSSWMVWIGDWG